MADRLPSREVAQFATVARELVQPITRFFEETLVMAEDPSLRAARLGLLAFIAALAPEGLDWAAIDTATKITQ